MLKSVLNAFRSPELRKKLFFTFAILAIYRFGTFVPVPGISREGISDALGGANASVLNFLNLFSEIGRASCRERV